MELNQFDYAMLPAKSRNGLDGKRMHSLRPLCKLFVVVSCAAI